MIRRIILIKYEYIIFVKAVVALNNRQYSVFDIRSLTWDEWSYPEGVILPIVTLGTIRPEDSGAARNATAEFHSETQVTSRLGMSGGGSPRHAQIPLSGERRKTLLINEGIKICIMAVDP